MNNKSHEINWRLLVKVAKGQASAAEMAEFQLWLKESPEINEAIFEEIREIYEDQDPELSAKTESAFACFLDHNRLIQHPQYIRPALSRWQRLRMTRVAAATALLLLLSSVAYLFRKELIPGSIALQQQKDIKWKEINVQYGKQVYVTLADGSVIRVGPGSSLRYPETFNGRERRVHLEGTAFFEVHKDPAHPFIVQTSKLETRVLGTSFNIEAYKEEPLARVTVVTGKVAVSKNSNGREGKLLAYLTPEEQIVFDNRDDTFRVKTITENAARATREGKFVFDSSSLADVALALERRYGIEVQLADQRIANMHLTSIMDGSSLDRMTMMLRMTTGLRVQRHGNNLYISSDQ